VNNATHDARPPDGLDALTDGERQTLRLIVRGHDAKSIARHFDLSVHTINERLREARRKLGVSSSREAARMLLAHDGATHESLGDTTLGDAVAPAPPAASVLSTNDRHPAFRPVPLAIGTAAMSLALLLVAIAPTAQPEPVAAPAVAPAEAVDARAEVEAAARRWLALVDAGRWDDSWQATGAQFRALNTAAVWASVSEKVRTPLGAMRSRVLIGQEDVPAPPQGYRLIKFRTSFANKAQATETLTLVREEGGWRVTGVWIG
jgi:DNA-binding CsgD family transcriptional regulator